MKKNVASQVPPFQEQAEIRDRAEVEAMIDETVDETFPASDPPNWSAIATKCEASKKRDQEANEAKDDKHKKDAA